MVSSYCKRIKAQRSICYNVHAFNFEEFLEVSSDIVREFLKISAILVLVSYNKPVSYRKNV